MKRPVRVSLLCPLTFSRFLPQHDISWTSLVFVLPSIWQTKLHTHNTDKIILLHVLIFLFELGDSWPIGGKHSQFLTCSLFLYARSVMISTVKPTRCTNVSNLYHFGMTLYMFRRSFPPSSGLHDCTYSCQTYKQLNGSIYFKLPTPYILAVNIFFLFQPNAHNTLNTYYTFILPCIVMYFCGKSNQMHQCLKFIWFWNSSTCFGRSFRPSSGVHDCTYSSRHMSNRYCLLASRQQYLDSSMYSLELLMMDGKTVRNM